MELPAYKIVVIKGILEGRVNLNKDRFDFKHMLKPLRTRRDYQPTMRKTFQLCCGASG